MFRHGCPLPLTSAAESDSCFKRTRMFRDYVMKHGAGQVIGLQMKELLFSQFLEDWLISKIFLNVLSSRTSAWLDSTARKDSRNIVSLGKA